MREIKDAKTGAATDFFELVSETTLPRWNSTTTGWCVSEIQPQCPVCMRDGFFNVTREPLNLTYERIPEFYIAETYEHFGKSRLNLDFTKSLLAVPFLVVDESIQKVLNGEHGVKFQEVRMGIFN